MANQRGHSFSEDELKAVVRAATGDWSGSTLEEHVREVCADLRQVIRHTSTAAYLVREVSAVPLLAEGFDPESLIEYPAYYHRFDPMSPAFGDASRPVTTLDGAAARQGMDLRRSPYLNDFLLSRLGIQRILGTNIPIAPNVTLALSFHRAKNLDDFSEKDVVAVSAALPGMGRGFATTFARERSLELMRQAEGSGETSGMATYSDQLELIEATGGARALLVSLDEEGGLHDVLSVAKRLVLRLKKDRGRGFLDCSLTKGADEGLVSIRVIALRTEGNGIRVHLLLDRVVSRLELVVARMGEKYQLTRREVEVVSLLLEGHTQGEIATRLEIARTGVRDHLVSIRRKLDVNTNEQLLARLMGLV